MLEPGHAGYSTSEHRLESRAVEFSADRLERIFRLVLAVCFMGVLGLEFWLLISALGIG